MKNSFKTLSLAFVFISFAASAGGLFKLSNRTITTTGAPITDDVRSTINAFLDSVEDEVNLKLPAADGTTYLRGIADSSVTSGAGIGVDYASPFSLFILGPQVGLGAKLGEGNSTRKLVKGDVKPERIQGAASQAAIMGGLNLAFLPNIHVGPFDSEKLKIFAHFFTYKFNVSDVKIKTTSFGVHGQYNFFRPRKFAMGLFRWGGVDFTTGFRSNNMQANVSKALKETKSSTVTLNTISTAVSGTVEGTANVGAKAKTYTIPLEVSTNVRLAYLFGFFGGLGGDINFGSAKANASIVAPFSMSTNPGTYGATGDATLDLGQSKKPHLADLRYFLGPNLELGVLSIYAQYTQAFISKTIGVNVGVKAFW